MHNKWMAIGFFTFVSLTLPPYLLAQTTPSDDCVTATAITSVPFASTSDTTNATSDATDPSQSCGSIIGTNSKSVWYSFTPTCNGTLIVQTCNSNYDTVLTIYTGSCGNLTEIACSDNVCDIASQIETHVETGIPLLIEITALGTGSGGTLEFTLNMQCCTLPETPANPIPSDGGFGIPTLTNLSWGSTTTAQKGSPVIPNVIYGSDDRLDQYEITDAAWLTAGDATVVLVDRSDLVDNGNGTLTLTAGIYGLDRNLCLSERFYYQPDPGSCSGFLVAPDIVATAGHCIDASNYTDVAFIFGFVMLEPYTAATVFEASEVYYATDVIDHQQNETGADYALVRLDRSVSNHQPLSVRRSGTVADQQSLLVIGHPSGLPRKYSNNAYVRDNSPAAYFVANLDTYGGNSGSAVLNTDTMQVEGILVRGETDFVWEGDCWVSHVCLDEDCNGEEITRSTEFASQLPFLLYDVYLGTCKDGMQLIGSDLSNPSYSSGQLLSDTQYCWQVVARSDCGTILGPVWSFTTAPPLPPAMMRAVSRMTHGSAGTYDIEVINPGSVEGRAGGPRELICTFDQPLQRVNNTVDDVAITSGTVEEVSVDNNILTIRLSGATDHEYLVVSFPGITGSDGTTVVQTLCIGVLAGDIGQLGSNLPDKVVNIYDLIAVKNAFDMSATSSNFRADVTQASLPEPDGIVNIYDLIAIKDNMDRTLPESCPFLK